MKKNITDPVIIWSVREIGTNYPAWTYLTIFPDVAQKAAKRFSSKERKFERVKIVIEKA